MLTLLGWKDEGIGWYGVNKTAVNNNTGSNNSYTSNGNSNVNTGGNTNNGNNNTIKEPNVPKDNNTTTPTHKTIDETTVNQMVLDLINKERASKGLTPLKWDANLYLAAKIRAEEIKIRYDHIRPDGRDFDSISDDPGMNINVGPHGENIMQNYRFGSNEEAANYIFNIFKNSPGHYKNMMRSGYYFYASYLYENKYFVQLFRFKALTE